MSAGPNVSESEGRRRVLGVVVLVFFGLAALCQGWVQVVERGSILAKASERSRFVLSEVEKPKRGTIFTADGKPLAQDEDTRVLNVDFRKVPRAPAFFMDMAAATGIPASEFLQLADSNRKSMIWREPISATQASQLEDVKTQWRADGISLAPSGRRSYPFGVAAASFIGVDADGKPRCGMELGDNAILSGTPGRTVGLVDRSGHFLPMRLDERTVPKVDGQNITLTIDSELQVVAADAIRQAVEDNKADQGVAIVMDPRDGDILAMANWPSFDPNTLGDAISQDQAYGFDPSYMAVLEPGSMFKILTLAKAYDMGVVDDHSLTYCHGTLAVGKRSVSCDSHHGNRAHGLLNPTMAIAKSCNVTAATWALRIGYDNYVKYMESLGIMSKPHLGLPGERPGLFNYNDPAVQLHLATLGFGQSVNATPIQLADDFAMIGNNGLRMQPRLIKQIGARVIPPKALGRIVRPESAQKVLHIMQAVIESDAGTGRDLRIPGYLLGGKTGTAQKVNHTTHSMKGGGYVANFVGFVPGDKPQAIILVMVDNPKAGKYYGASVAGPVFQLLAKNVIRRFAIPPTMTAGQMAAKSEQIKEEVAESLAHGHLISAPVYTAEEIKADEKAREQAQANVKEIVDQATGAALLNAQADKPAKKRIRTSKTNTMQLYPDMLAQLDVDENSAPSGHRHRHRRRSLWAERR